MQFKVQQMVPLSDVEQLFRELQQLYADVPSYKQKKGDDLVGEVKRLVGYANSTTVWFKNFTKFMANVYPSLPATSQADTSSDQSFSVENLIKRVANPTDID
jgi:hypothetical protein